MTRMGMIDRVAESVNREGTERMFHAYLELERDKDTLDRADAIIQNLPPDERQVLGEAFRVAGRITDQGGLTAARIMVSLMMQAIRRAATLPPDNQTVTPEPSPER